MTLRKPIKSKATFTGMLISAFFISQAHARTSYSLSIDEASGVATHTLFSDGGHGFEIFKQLNLEPVCKDGTPGGGDQSGSFGSCDKFVNELDSDPSFRLNSFVAQAQTSFSMIFMGAQKVDLAQELSATLPAGVSAIFPVGHLDGNGFAIHCSTGNCDLHLDLARSDDFSEFTYSKGKVISNVVSPVSFYIKDLKIPVKVNSRTYSGFFATDISASDLDSSLASACLADVRECSIYIHGTDGSGHSYSLGQIDIVSAQGAVQGARLTIPLPNSVKLFSKDFVQRTNFYLPAELTVRIKQALIKAGGSIERLHMRNEFLTLKGAADGRISASLTLPAAIN